MNTKSEGTVKSMSGKMPNQQLKAERELRGWSQKYVAEQISADHYYLSRWERGTTVPSPYYRQKLCDLFGKNAKELGLLQEKVDQSDKPLDKHETSIVDSIGRVDDPAIPLLIGDAAELVGRGEMISQLRERLCAGKNLVLTALNGIPGVGKTALAIALTHDDEVLAHFSDGVLWAAVGSKPHVLGILSRWGALLGIANADAANFTSIEAWSLAVHSIIGMRRMLLVIDDVWDIEAALALKVGGFHCAYLITTRFPHIALQFTTEGATHVQELNERDSTTLLERLVPEVVKSERKAIENLIQAVGGLPLALTLMGKYLRLQAYSGQPRRIRAAIQALRNVEVRLRLSEPQALLERAPGLPEQTSVSLQAVIALSVQQMSVEAREALYMLAVFPAKPNTFSEEAALAVCQTTVETLDVLSDTGLLESRGPGRYTLHQTIADYARMQLIDSTPYDRLAAYFADYVHAHEQDDDMLEEESGNIFAAMREASAQQQHANLVKGTHAYVRFLQARGLYDQAEVHLKQAYDSAVLLQDNAAIALTLCYLGEIAEIHSDFAQAETYLLEGLAMARQGGDSQLISRLLRLLGLVVCRQGDYAQAEAYLQEGLTLARQGENPAPTGLLLRVLGSVADDQGKYVQAIVYLQESLVLARQSGDLQELTKVLINLGFSTSYRGDNVQAEAYWREGLVLAQECRYRRSILSLSINLGCLEYERGNYAEAQRYWEECLPVADQIGDRQNKVIILMNLGTMASDQGKYIQAEGYLQESLSLARQIKHHKLIGSALNDWAECQLKQQHWEAASATFYELQTRATKGNQQDKGVALYGLARIAAAHGNLDEALQQGQAALAILESIEHFRIPEVRQWLSSIQ